MTICVCFIWDRSLVIVGDLDSEFRYKWMSNMNWMSNESLKNWAKGWSLAIRAFGVLVCVYLCIVDLVKVRSCVFLAFV